VVRIDEREQIGEQRKRQHTRGYPPGRSVHAQPRPEGKASRDLGKRRSDVGYGGHAPCVAVAPDNRNQIEPAGEEQTGSRAVDCNDDASALQGGPMVMGVL
jgi:hypothetical protein